MSRQVNSEKQPPLTQKTKRQCEHKIQFGTFSIIALKHFSRDFVFHSLVVDSGHIRVGLSGKGTVTFTHSTQRVGRNPGTCGPSEWLLGSTAGIIRCWVYPSKRTWELHRSVFRRAVLTPLIIKFTEVGPAPRLFQLCCQGWRGVEWPGRPSGGWGLAFL